MKACELDQRAVELGMAEEETRRALNAAHREYNKALVRPLELEHCLKLNYVLILMCKHIDFDCRNQKSLTFYIVSKPIMFGTCWTMRY